MTILFSRFKDAIADRYTVQRELGRGGMAVVYLAEDKRNHRQVAVKMLEPAIASAIGMGRFLREVEIAARLVHPHILPLFDSGEADGLLFYVTPYVTGGPLRARLSREGALGLDEALRIVRQVGSALQVAHEQGIVHRDIKPENILLQGDTAYVADFGIALALREVDQERLTTTGHSLGTPAYMSPEQASGDRRIDQRSDIYSLGCLLYEMLTGDPPFVGSARAVLARILTEDPVRPRVMRPAVPVAVDATVIRAMAKTPVDRYRTVDEFLAALESESPAPRRRRPGRRAVLAGSGALLALLALGLWHFWPGPTSAAGRAESQGPLASPIASLAVLPFTNRQNDSAGEYLSIGIADDLIGRLAEVPDLRVAARSSAFSFQGKAETLRAIAFALSVDAILEGSVNRLRDSIQVTARLIDAVSELQLWAGNYAGSIAEVTAIENDLLEGTLTALGRNRPGRRLAANGGAYDLYLKGRYYYEKYETDDVRRALQFFIQSIDRDPAFALGYAGLSDAYYQLSTRWLPASQAMPRARAAAEQALKLNADLAQAHVALSRVQAYWEFDWAGAEQSLRKAVAQQPGLAAVREAYGVLLTFRGQTDSALAQLRLAQKLDPLSPAIAFEAVWPLLFGNRLNEALDAFRQLALTGEQGGFDASLGEIYALQGDYPGAIRLLEAYRRRHPGMDARYYAVLARGYHAVGRRKEAQDILDMLLRYSRGGGNAYMLAILYAGIGEPAQALDWLERCASLKNENIVLIKVDPEFASLHSEPRYQALLKQVGLN